MGGLTVVKGGVSCRPHVVKRTADVRRAEFRGSKRAADVTRAEWAEAAVSPIQSVLW